MLGGSIVLTYAQTTQPSARERLDEMLKPTTQTSARPLQPAGSGLEPDRTTGTGAVAPSAPSLSVLREGSFIVDRVGRLTRASEGQGWEFTFESDGQALRDPPVLVLPNLKLMLMEDQLKETQRDLKFRVTGMVTEYRGRNYILLEKVVVLSN